MSEKEGVASNPSRDDRDSGRTGGSDSATRKSDPPRNDDAEAVSDDGDSGAIDLDSVRDRAS
jgi:hypothetical protein